MSQSSLMFTLAAIIIVLVSLMVLTSANEHGSKERGMHLELRM